MRAEQITAPVSIYGARGGATIQKVAGSIFHWLNPSGAEVDSASNRNKYQEYFLGVKAAGAYGWQPYHLHVPIIYKSVSLNLLEH
jgi:hypothetical protein